MNKYLGFFEGVFYINLDSRTDRKELFEKRAEEVGVVAERISAITPLESEVFPLYQGHNDPQRKFKVGCTLSHQHVIRLAKEKGLKNCLIFEDDCVFLEDYKIEIQKCVDELKDIEWDLFYIGGEPNNHCFRMSDNLYQIKDGGVYTTHAYAINHTFYDAALSISAHHVDTIDILYLNYNQNLRKCILSKKLLAVQDVSYSDLWDTVKDNSQWMINAWEKYIK